jgi:LacI family transcriptional regulator
MATIKDVAALAGISYTTVSHVVNKTRPVSEEVRLKVEAAIKSLDYVPSAVARSLKAKTTATIGLLVPNSLNPYFAELARGIEDYCERNGYCVILCNSDDNPEKQRSYLRVLLEKRIDGLIVASGRWRHRLAQGLAGVRTPMVIVDRGLDGVDADLVRIDHEYGAYLATRHLLELGHRDIATIGGPSSTSVAQMRLAGFCRALRRRASRCGRAHAGKRFHQHRRLQRGGDPAGKQSAECDLRRQRHDRDRCCARPPSAMSAYRASCR